MGLKLLLISLVLVQVWLVDFAVGSCDPSFGPVGNAECIPGIQGYTGAQWATCLSNSYIIEKSHQRHICKDMPNGGKPIYCYYQCQLEMYEQDSGNVFGKCKCDSSGGENLPDFDINDLVDNDYDWRKYLLDYNAKPGPSTAAPIVLPDWCSSPDGTECKWYNSCLNKKCPCSAAENGFVLEFAEQLCNLNRDSFSFFGKHITFSPTGVKWVNAVRKCLQVALVPQIRPWMTPTCKDIKLEALATHEMCYQSASLDAPFMCELTCQDWGKFFWTVKSKGQSLQKLSFAETLKSAVEVASTCGKNASIVGQDCPTEILRLTLKTVEYYTIPNRVQARDDLAAEVTDALAKRLRWNAELMGWFAYAPNVTHNHSSDLVTIDILLGDKTILGLNDDNNEITQFSLSNVTDDFTAALEQGLLYDLTGLTSAATLEGCADTECRQKFMKTTAGPRPPPPKTLKLKSSATHLQLGFFVACLCGMIGVRSFLY